MNLNVLTYFVPILSCLPSFKRRQLQCSWHVLAVIIATGMFYYTIESMVPQLQPSWTSGIKIIKEFNNNILWHILNCLVCICAATKHTNKCRSDQFRLWSHRYLYSKKVLNSCLFSGGLCHAELFALLWSAATTSNSTTDWSAAESECPLLQIHVAQCLVSNTEHLHVCKYRPTSFFTLPSFNFQTLYFH